MLCDIVIWLFTAIEVYEFPEECNIEELKAHFIEDPYRAHSKGSKDLGLSFVLHYSSEGSTVDSA